MSAHQLYIVIAYDGTDDSALDRRMVAREEHLKVARGLKAEGKILHAGAMLNDNRVMIGSMLILSFPDRAELDEWLRTDPYVTGNVWQRIEVRPFQPAPL